MVSTFVTDGHNKDERTASRVFALGVRAGLRSLPEAGDLNVLVEPDRVPRELGTRAQCDDTESLKQDRSTRRGDNILVLGNQEDDGDEEKDAGRDKEGLPVTVVASKERRRDGTDGAPVDRGVEPVVDTLVGDRRRDDDNLAALERLLAQLAGVLLADERANVRLDGATSNTHNHDGESEEAECAVWIGDGVRSCASDEDNVADAARKC